MKLDIDILNKISILCVEDEPQTLEQLTLSLESFCKEFYSATNGEEAIKILKNKSIDVVITDIKMPKIDGLELLEFTKNNFKETKVILVSAYSETEFLLKAIKLKADGCILKPINLQELFSIITKNVIDKVIEKEADNKDNLVKFLRIIGGKRVQILEYILEHKNENDEFIGTYDEITKELNSSKPTVVNTFKSLIEEGILDRIKNGHYKIKNLF
jgi:YesN/AraC family two-component response regulator